jgi:hypothetical protein
VTADSEKPKIVVIGDLAHEPLSDADIAEIHDGLLIPNEKAIHSMAREIRKWRGVEDPDGV